VENLKDMHVYSPFGCEKAFFYSIEKQPIVFLLKMLLWKRQADFLKQNLEHPINCIVYVWQVFFCSQPGSGKCRHQYA